MFLLFYLILDHKKCMTRKCTKNYEWYVLLFFLSYDPQLFFVFFFLILFCSTKKFWRISYFSYFSYYLLFIFLVFFWGWFVDILYFWNKFWNLLKKLGIYLFNYFYCHTRCVWLVSFSAQLSIGFIGLRISAFTLQSETTCATYSQSHRGF